MVWHDKLLHELNPKNRKLIEIREKLQKKIDYWHKKQNKKKINLKKYEIFLKNIGYLVKPGSNFKIKTNNVDKEISEIFSVEHIIPSVGQGIIALQCRKDDNDIISILNKTNHEETYQRANAERNVLKVLEGDCETAIGAHAVIREGVITLEAELFSLDGTKRFYEKKSSKIEKATELGKEVGKILKTKSNNTYKR